MHIDDQLIRLDGNIEDITDHLDEQLLNTATISAVESHDALLTQEEENYLFSSMPEVMDPMHSLQLIDDQADSEIDQMIAAGLPSPLMPSPLLSDEPKTGEPLKPVKQEIKEEIEEVEEQQQSSQLYGNYVLICNLEYLFKLSILLFDVGQLKIVTGCPNKFCVEIFVKGKSQNCEIRIFILICFCQKIRQIEGDICTAWPGL